MVHLSLIGKNKLTTKKYNKIKNNMKSYRKIKVDSEIQINTDFITKCSGGDIVSIIDKHNKSNEAKKEDVIFRIKGEDIISAFNRNSNTDN